MKARPYQLRVIDAVFAAWDGGLDRPMISMATGGGKTYIFCEIIKRHLERRRADGPVIVLAHRRELIEQAAEHLRKTAPELRIEQVIGSPGLAGSTKRLKAIYRWRATDVLVTTPQTLASASTMRDLPNPSLVIADEAHHYASDSFKRVMTALGCFSGRARALGVTATPFREDYRRLDEVFEAIVANVDIGWLISHKLDPRDLDLEVECIPGEGYLVPPRLRHLTIDGLDLSEVPTSRMSGAVDYREKELAEAMEAVGAFEIVAKAVMSELPDSKGVIFAPTVASSKHLTQIMNDLGATCGHIDGTMDKNSRKKIISDFREDRIRWLCNVGIVSEGFDVPMTDTVVLARPTRSRIFFRQAVGRALRPAPGKRFATVFDVAGASDGHSLAGVEALTDSDVLEARDGEQLTDLLERTDRARGGWLDRIAAHTDALRERQNDGERSTEQIKITAENYGDKLPGLTEFARRTVEPLDGLLNTTTEGIDLALTASTPPAKTIDDLTAIERRVSDMVAEAARKGSIIERLKTGMREALVALKEEPEGDVATAMVTGYVGSVRGDLFGEEEERPEVKAPGAVQGLKLRGPKKEPKPVFTAREGWMIRSTGGHLWAPIHNGREIRGIAIAVMVTPPNGTVEAQYVPISWFERGNQVDYIAVKEQLFGAEDAYRKTIDFAADETSAPNFLAPMAAWRKRPASDSARAVARRINPTHPQPDNADAGYIADVIEFGQRNNVVNSIASYVASQVAR